DQIAQEHRRRALPGQANLFIIYAQDFSRGGGEVGKTYKEFGMVLSDKRLRETTQNFTESFSQYAESTMLHELGHQLGLDHNDQQGCIMNPEVEAPKYAGEFTGYFTQVKFCDFELNQLSV